MIDKMNIFDNDLKLKMQMNILIIAEDQKYWNN